MKTRFFNPLVLSTALCVLLACSPNGSEEDDVVGPLSDPTGCTLFNPCGLPNCVPSKTVTVTESFGSNTTITNTFEYITVAGKKVPSRMLSQTTGLVPSNGTTTYTYDSQGRETRSTTLLRTAGVVQNTSTETLYSGSNCFKTRQNVSVDGRPSAYITFDYDGQGRLVRTSTFLANGQRQSQAEYDNFNGQGLPRTQRSIDATGTITGTSTSSYQNCQLATSEATSNFGGISSTISIRNEFNAQRLIGRSVSKTKTAQAGFDFEFESVTTYEYSCN
jgi:YD repeat-containing protein